MKTQIAYLGIDVSKRKLHLANPEKFLGEFENNVAGHQQMIDRMTSWHVERVVLEASGGYERLVCEAMQEAGLPVTVAQPACVRHFALSVKVLAKTDAIDAKVIARFAEATKPALTPKTPENIRKFRALCDRRAQVVEDRVRESNRLETCADAAMREHISDNLERLAAIEKQLDKDIACAMKTDEQFQRKLTVMTSQVGVGDKTACVLLAHFPELGTLDRGEVAALAGVAPYARESGNWQGRRRIYGGRGAVRKAMYMAARTATRCCPVIREVYLRLRANGKSFKVAIVACMRKMLIRLNTILKEAESSEFAANGTQST